MKSILLSIKASYVTYLCLSEVLHGATMSHLLLPVTEEFYLLVGIGALNVLMLTHHLGVRLNDNVAFWLNLLNWVSLAYLTYYISLVDHQTGMHYSLSEAWPVVMGVGLAFFTNVAALSTFANVLREHGISNIDVTAKSSIKTVAQKRHNFSVTFKIFIHDLSEWFKYWTNKKWPFF